MRLFRDNFDRALFVAGILAASLVFGVFLRTMPKTYAEKAGVATSETRFATVFYNGEKMVVKTTAQTPRGVLEKLKIELGEGDVVEPGLDEEFEGDFYMNIYRARPVIVTDGTVSTFVMTASYDAAAVAKAAGFELGENDEIGLVFNTKFLEFGAASVYQITRHTQEQMIAEAELPEISKNYTPTAEIKMKPLTARMGRNRYTINGILREETYYDLDMSRVMKYRLKDGCGDGTYSVRADGVKVDYEGYVLVAANLERYPLCSVVETSLGMGKVYDTGAFARKKPEQFDIATDWTYRNGV